MTINMSRSVNKRSGYQQNTISDKSSIGSIAGDFNGAAVGRFTRGRIDKAFAVSAEKLDRQLGDSVSLNVTALGEAKIQAYEALRYGAQQMVISRLIASDAVNKLLIVGTGVAPAGGGAAPAVWSTGLQSAGLPAGGLIAFKHLDCFNDGLDCQINASVTEDAKAVLVPSKVITVQFADPVDGKIIIGPFTGSLDPDARDEYRKSYFIQDVIEAGTSALEVIEVASGAEVPVTSPFYGLLNNKPKFASETLKYFTEGMTVYTAAELAAGVDRLRRARPNFTYLSVGGSENVALITAVADLGLEINKQFVFDVPGRFDPEAAARFIQSLGASVKTLYAQAFWAPVRRDNPIAGGKAWFGTSGQQIGLRCARNAQVNAQGIAPRNQPIAGSDYGLSGTNASQTYDPSDDELELLAENQINPCIFKEYPTGGAKYAWVDSLTGAQTDGATKLIAVAEMATCLDDNVSSFGQQALQKPMNEAIKMTLRFLGPLLKAMQSAGWFEPTGELEGRAYEAEVAPNEAAPYDTMDTRYNVCYVGTNRKTIGGQTIVRKSAAQA
ncbi:hypothetical protein [Pseudomonas viridiflava]|uniref:hypothetical protein n=1 Tax=Pseudomonas viridiflava TaxID=33069 RepID=UPI000F01F254|nr:hypothetical protein [Pseudomonas viridiflava]